MYNSNEQDLQQSFEQEIQSQQEYSQDNQIEDNQSSSLSIKFNNIGTDNYIEQTLYKKINQLTNQMKQFQLRQQNDISQQILSEKFTKKSRFSWQKLQNSLESSNKKQIQNFKKQNQYAHNKQCFQSNFFQLENKVITNMILQKLFTLKETWKQTQSVYNQQVQKTFSFLQKAQNHILKFMRNWQHSSQYKQYQLENVVIIKNQLNKIKAQFNVQTGFKGKLATLKTYQQQFQKDINQWKNIPTKNYNQINSLIKENKTLNRQLYNYKEKVFDMEAELDNRIKDMQIKLIPVKKYKQLQLERNEYFKTVESLKIKCQQLQNQLSIKENKINQKQIEYHAKQKVIQARQMQLKKQWNKIKKSKENLNYKQFEQVNNNFCETIKKQDIYQNQNIPTSLFKKNNYNQQFILNTKHINNNFQYSTQPKQPNFDYYTRTSKVNEYKLPINNFQLPSKSYRYQQSPTHKYPSSLQRLHEAIGDKISTRLSKAVSGYQNKDRNDCLIPTHNAPVYKKYSSRKQLLSAPKSQNNLLDIESKLQKLKSEIKKQIDSIN